PSAMSSWRVSFACVLTSSHHGQDDLTGTVLAGLRGATLLEGEVAAVRGEVGRARSGGDFIQRKGRGNCRNELARGGKVGQRRHANLVCLDDDSGESYAALGGGVGETREARGLCGHEDPAGSENAEGPRGVVAPDDVEDDILVADGLGEVRALVIDRVV